MMQTWQQKAAAHFCIFFNLNNLGVLLCGNKKQNQKKTSLMLSSGSCHKQSKFEAIFNVDFFIFYNKELELPNLSSCTTIR